VTEDLPQQNLNNNPSIIHSNEILPVCQHQVESEEINQWEDIHHVLNIVNSQVKDPLLEISNNTLLNEQLRDSKLSIIYNRLLNRKPLSNPAFFIDPDTRLLSIYSQEDKNPTIPKIVIPKSLISKVCRIAHLTHFGVQKTYQIVKDRYFWHGMFVDVQNYVASCTVCITSKIQRIPPAPFQHPIVPTHPNDAISLDLVGPFNNGFHILTVIDLFSRHLELYPLRKIDANSVALKIFKYITTFGRPSLILTDLGTQFTAETFKNLNNMFGIDLIHTTTGRPQANAISERINTSIKNTINAFQSEGKNFFHAVDIHKSLYNASKHSTTGFSPNAIHFARDLSIITDTFDVRKVTPELNESFALFQVYETINKIYEQVYENITSSQEAARLEQQRRAKLRTFKPKDIVYVRPVGKFVKRLTGPFMVKKIIGPVTYSIQRLGNPEAKMFSIHADRLFLAPRRRNFLRFDPDLQPNEFVDSASSVSNQFFSRSSHESLPQPSLDSQFPQSAAATPDHGVTIPDQCEKFPTVADPQEYTSVEQWDTSPVVTTSPVLPTCDVSQILSSAPDAQSALDSLASTSSKSVPMQQPPATVPRATRYNLRPRQSS
jgi:transposase InsO family protein